MLNKMFIQECPSYMTFPWKTSIKRFLSLVLSMWNPFRLPLICHHFFLNVVFLVCRQLCLLLQAEDIYKCFSEILLHEEDMKFAAVMIQTLSTILLTSTELFELRTQLKDLKTQVRIDALENQMWFVLEQNFDLRESCAFEFRVFVSLLFLLKKFSVLKVLTLTNLLPKPSALAWSNKPDLRGCFLH